MKRLVLSLLGLTGIAVLIWFAGREFAFADFRPLASPWARAGLIALVFLAWGVRRLLAALQARRADREMVDGIVEQSDPTAEQSVAEVQELTQQFEEAMDTLRRARSRSGGGSALALYDLPWYIIIGPPGSGKSTALINSGLEFPLADRFGKEALRGVGGTRNCDWWFTEEAILLDTAGRFTTQDSHAAVDKAGWEGFLELLRRHRRRRPVNGVMVAVSLLDLLTLSEEELRDQAMAIRQRVRELDEYFGIRFPIYVLVTKADMLAGFNEFFAKLNNRQREQVWGFTFPVDDDPAVNPLDDFTNEFDGLLERVESQVPAALSEERDLNRRVAIYAFPQQLASVSDLLNAFLRAAFPASKFEDAPMVRGVYFTSGTQEGTPIDRLARDVARSLGMDVNAVAPPRARSKSYFLTDLLRRVIFAEAGLAGTNQKLERRRAWLQGGAYAATLVAVAAMVVLWSTVYLSARRYLADVGSAADTAATALGEVSPDRLDPPSVAPALDAVRAIPGVEQRNAAAGFLADLGAFGLSPRPQVAPRARAAYARTLDNVLLPRVMLRLEQQMSQGGTSADYQYEALKSYMMLVTAERFESDPVTEWVRFDWDRTWARDVPPAVTRSLEAHLDVLLEDPPTPLPLAPNADLVRATQRAVSRMPLEERVYSRVARRVRREKLEPFTVFDRAGPRSERVFVRRSGAPLSEGVEGLFTKQGHRRFTLASQGVIGELVAERWILGPYAQTQQENRLTVTAQVQDLYLKTYARQYESLILDLDLAPFSTVDEAADMLNILSEPEFSPLVALLEEVRRETDFSLGNGGAGQEEQDNSWRERLEGLFGGDAPGQQQVDAGMRQVEVLRDTFRPLHRLVEAGDGASAPIDHLTGLLRKLYRHLEVLRTLPPGTGVPPRIANEGQQVIRELQLEADVPGQPPLVAGILSSAAGQADRLGNQGVRQNLNAQWTEGLAFCESAIDGRYPIARGSDVGIRLEDFSRFFGPGGIAQQFFQTSLKDHVDVTRRPWKAYGGQSMQIRADAIAQFERADLIRRTYFGAAGGPTVRFELRPLGMDADIEQLNLEIGGKAIRYSHGPPLTEYVEWPGSEPDAEVRLELVLGAGDRALARHEGPWALFRLFDASRIEPTERPEYFVLTLEVDGHQAQYELVARSAFNPFSSNVLEGFSCPGRL